MGTALTAEQARELGNLAPLVLLCLDADAAGQQAAVARRLGAAGPARAARRRRSRPASDPADIVGEEGGAERMRALLDRAVPFARFQVERTLERALGADATARTTCSTRSRGVIRPLQRRDRPRRPGQARLRPARDQPGAGRERGPLGAAAAGRAARAIGRAAAPPANGARQALDRREQSERAFLALCIALPELGEAKLADADLDALFTSPLTRLAAERLRGHLEHPASILADAPELAELIPEIVLRAGQLDATPATLELEALQLDLHRLDREITAAAHTGDPRGRHEHARRRAPAGARRDPPPPAVERKFRPTHELVFVSWRRTGSRPSWQPAARSSRSRARSASTRRRSRTGRPRAARYRRDHCPALASPLRAEDGARSIGDACGRGAWREVLRECSSHGYTAWVRSGTGGRYRCKLCRSEAVTARRRRVKRILDRGGRGCCVLCGYDRFPGALQFHHLDPAEKSFALSVQGVGRSLEKARAEAAKCVLMCANCHAEVEGGARYHSALKPRPISPVPRGRPIHHSGVIQWQNARLLTEWLWVRVPPPEPHSRREGRLRGGLRRSRSPRPAA